MEVRAKRVYEDREPADGTRVLVDRLWPRGVSKEAAALDNWATSVAPSDALREYFDHDPTRWAAFQRGYRAELDGRRKAVQAELLDHADGADTLTLVYATTDETHNNAVVLASFIREEFL